ncbi:MAG: MFS transporter [Dehalococcoidia bacterium]
MTTESKRQTSGEQVPDDQPSWMRPLAAFRHHNYRLYFSGQLISLIGTWMQNIAQGWLVFKLTGSPFALGIVTALQSLPVLFFALIGGVLADRVAKYRLIVFTQAAMAILALLLGIDVTAGTVQIWHIYILASLLGTVQALDMPSRQAFTVEMVGKDDLLNAVALNSVLFNMARIFGPAVAGLTIAFVGLALCFYLNAASFLAVIAGLLLMRPAEFRIHGALQKGGSAKAQLIEGLRYVQQTPSVLTIIVLAASFALFAFNSSVILPVFAGKVLNVGSAGYGALTAAMGVGSLIVAGAIAFARKARFSVLLAGMGLWALFAFGFAWSRFFPLSLLLLAGMGGSMMTFSTQSNTFVQSAVPDALRGRVMSLYMMLWVGSQPLGAFLTGSTASLWGAPVALTAGAALSGLVLVAAVLSRSRISLALPELAVAD